VLLAAGAAASARDVEGNGDEIADVEYSTSEPFSMISPVISWPRTRPLGAVVRPRTMCWSEPQMLVETTLRMTPWLIFLPCGFCILGKSMD
jgi:hypothetical protein